MRAPGQAEPADARSPFLVPLVAFLLLLSSMPLLVGSCGAGIDGLGVMASSVAGPPLAIQGVIIVIGP